MRRDFHVFLAHPYRYLNKIDDDDDDVNVIKCLPTFDIYTILNIGEQLLCTLRAVI